MKKKFLILLIFIVLLSSCAKFGFITMNHENQSKILTELCQKIKTTYVYKATADSICTVLQNNFKNGKYKSLTKPNDFTKAVEKDVFRVCKDTHFWFLHSPGYAYKLKRKQAKEDENKIDSSTENKYKKNNYGFEKYENIDSKTTYIKINQFVNPLYPNALKKADELLALAKNTNNIIFDLRENRGGYGGMVSYIVSHFFNKPTVLSKTIKRHENITVIDETTPKNLNLSNKSIYILVSSYTYSAAEAFAYTLKHHSRAVVIGKNTAGGAHSSLRLILTDDFVVQMPAERSEHPITGTDWERTGVKPNISIEPKLALQKAKELITSKSIMQNKNHTYFDLMQTYENANFKVCIPTILKTLQESTMIFQLKT